MARYYTSSYYDYLQYFSLPIHFLFFIASAFLFFIFTIYINYESLLEGVMDNFKMYLMVIPVVLLLFVHWLSTEDRARVPFFLSLPERDSLHRVGGSPIGVAALLVLLIVMISHRSALQEKWFPMFSR